MSSDVGFDRPIKRDWLDYLATLLAGGAEGEIALAQVRLLVGQTVADVPGSHGAAYKTLTVLRRIWVSPPDDHLALRGRALAVIGGLGADDRLAIHWAMCGLSYPFFIDAAAQAGRLLAIQDAFALQTVRARLTDRWGAKAMLPRATQRLMKTWEAWEVLAPGDLRASWIHGRRMTIGAPAAAVLAEARVAAEGPIDLEALQRAPELFPFELPDLRDVIRETPSLMLMRQGGQGWVVREA